jgi:alpha-amylase
MGNFNDNHDNARFLHWGSDDGKKKSFKALTAFTLTSVGIPIFYYGSE